MSPSYTSRAPRSSRRTLASRNTRDKKAREQLERALTHSGERERLKEFLREKLKECGWKDDLAKRCKEIMKDRGVKETSVDYLVKAVTPTAQSSVPNSIKAAFLEKIRTFSEIAKKEEGQSKKKGSPSPGNRHGGVGA